MHVEVLSITNIHFSNEENKNNHYLCNMFDVSAIYGYIGTLKAKPEGDFDAYKEEVKGAEVAFRSAFTQVALEVDEKKLILIYRDFNELAMTLKSFHPAREEAEWVAFEAMKAEEAAEYIKRVQIDLSGDTTTIKAHTEKRKQPTETSKLEKRLQDYGDLLSVKDLIEIFGCTPRTITNWEKKGWIVNVAETSDEVNAAGRKKRGQEKRYRKEAIIRSVFLQERYQSLV